MPMFNNQNDSSRLDDAGGADGMDGINFQERQTANFATFQPVD